MVKPTCKEKGLPEQDTGVRAKLCKVATLCTIRSKKEMHGAGKSD